MVGDFVQTNSTDGRQSEGKIYIQKPGKLRFEYANPATLEVIADGKEVAVNDRKMKTQETYSIGNTPLKFLLQDKIDLKADTQVLNVLQTPDEVMILLDDRHDVRRHVAHPPHLRCADLPAEPLAGARSAGLRDAGHPLQHRFQAEARPETLQDQQHGSAQEMRT